MNLVDTLIISDILIVSAILIFFAVLAWKKQALDTKGILISLIVGITTFLLAGMKGFAIIVALFVCLEIATRFGRRKKEIKFEKRGTGNVLGNCLAALIALFLGSITGFCAGIASALSDSFGSELGQLSKSQPVLITTLKKVKAGEDGGVTLFGFLMSVLGAMIIALLYYGLFEPNYIKAIIILIAGIIGSTMDSVIGALFERNKWITNNTTNFLSSWVAVLVGMLI